MNEAMVFIWLIGVVVVAMGAVWIAIQAGHWLYQWTRKR